MAVGLAPSFGQLLRHHRLRVGLSQERLAEQSDLSVNQISDLERDRRARPHPDTLRRLADALALDERERGTFVALARPGRQPRLPQSPSRLPVSLTSFVTHPDDLPAVRRRLDSTRLLTLTGAGGVGKTRLALEVANAFAAPSSVPPEQPYADGVLFISFANSDGCCELAPSSAAEASATSNLGDACRASTGHATIVSGEGSFEPGGVVTVTVVCDADLTGVAIPGIPATSRITKSSTEVIDFYRSVGG